MAKFISFFTFERMLILFVVCVIAFVGITLTEGFAWSWFFLFYIIFFPIRYFLIGTVGSAARKLYSQDFEGAQKMLKMTWKPEWLRFGMQGMYYFLQGAIDQNNKDVNAAEKHILKAIQLGLPESESTTMAYLNIAAIYVNKNRRQEAKEYLHKAKKMKSNNPQVQDFVKNIEQALAAPQMNMRMHQMMQQSGRGGFRKLK